MLVELFVILPLFYLRELFVELVYRWSSSTVSDSLSLKVENDMKLSASHLLCLPVSTSGQMF